MVDIGTPPPVRPPAVAPQLRRVVLASGPCAYCGDIWPSEVDHVIPKSRGGSSLRDNLAPSCKPCNAEKLNFTPEEWRQWRLRSGLPWPPPNTQDLVRDFLEPVLADATPEAIAALNLAAKQLSEYGREAPAPLRDDEAACPECRYIFRVSPKGKLRRHKIGEGTCPGSGALIIRAKEQ